MDWNNIIACLEEIFSFNAQRPLLFTQFYFWVFFAFVIAGFSLVYNRRLLRNTFLFAVSLFFYFKTSGLFVFILIFSTLSDFILGQCIYNTKSKLRKKMFLATSIVINLFVLSYFKYAYFFTDVYNSLFASEWEVINYLALWTNNLTGSGFTVDKILLPVGISFYTFQTISYSVDVFREKLKPVKNILDFGFYVSFFPGLVAGPIVRANEFIPQLYEKFFLSKRQFGIALFWILNGLAKKMILSDYLAVNFIDRVFTNPLMYTGFENLMSLFAYSLQVYADFSGYTDIAIGIAMLMGFYLPKNFNSPYKATNPSNFWKRWHISLSRWLTDYLYIPLGGNRNATFATYFVIGLIAIIVIFLAGNIWITLGIFILVLLLGIVAILFPSARKPINTNINVMNTMLLGGLWHGASWNFMIWGGLNGTGILSFRLWKKLNIYRKTLLTALLFILFVGLQMIFPRPVFVIGEVWTAIIFFGTFIEMIYVLITNGKPVKWIKNSWSIFLTFVFITFTRLFFRSGSNLDPAQANSEAWETAQNMVAKIGGQWEWSLIGDIIIRHRNVFILFVLGMIIHWLPDRFKRWYRYNFASLPLAVQLIIVVGAVFVIYQFVTSELQPFIYFQF
ncbi:MAG: MBOAT family protein [Bacteroidales bacterium]|jgi:D-alanyl-lipoteichoic acid acyltransferase DltB (MBOAT superfamily)|nr:MBOAT family protein [Bacteroidales bacterium]